MLLKSCINQEDALIWPWQVVSEVLFPTVDSSPAQRAPVLSGSPCTASAPPQSSVPSCDAQNSKEVISQLLQEAEGELMAAKSINLYPEVNCGEYILTYE